MGVDLGDLITRRTISLESLEGRVIAIDGYNALYQFLTVIRQADGTPLMDSKGRITSHLSGLFYRTVNLLEIGIKPVYVFDGKPPEIKLMEIERRKAHRVEAARKYEEALKAGDLEAARKYAMQAARLTEEMVKDAKYLLDALGVPWVQAPSEGEAQAAYMAAKGDVWACASQDYDSLLYGAPRLVRNITISGKRRKPRTGEIIEVKPELISLEEVLRILNLSREQLIEVAILIGTDYNPDGIRGVGPKRAYELIRKYGSLDRAIKILPEARFPIPPDEIKKAFLEPVITSDYVLTWRDVNREYVKEILCDEHDFSEARVTKALDNLEEALRKRRGKTSLEAWF